MVGHVRTTQPHRHGLAENSGVSRKLFRDHCNITEEGFHLPTRNSVVASGGVRQNAVSSMQCRHNKVVSIGRKEL
eukprot:12884084-Prorocentrum_lima.AAC.1